MEHEKLKELEKFESACESFRMDFVPAVNFSEADDLKTIDDVAVIFFKMGFNLDYVVITEILYKLGFVRKNVGTDSVWLLKRK